MLVVARRKPARLSLVSLSALGAGLACFHGVAQAQQTLPTISVGGARHGTHAAAPRRPAQPVAAVGPAAPSPILNPAPAPANFVADVARFGRGPFDVKGYVAGGTSTATKTATKILDIPQSVTILTKQQLQDRNSLSLGQALTYVPGVTVAQGEGNRDQITIRGQNTTADFFTDGVRDDAEYYRDLYNIEAVEVLKGPSALIFGRGGGGGVVNRVTKKADGETRREIQISSGSFARKRVTIDVGQAISDTLAVRLNALYEHTYGYRDFFKAERYGINPTLTWRPLEKTFVMLSYEHYRDRRTADRGIPSLGGFVFGGLNVYNGYPVPTYRNTFFGAGDPSAHDVNYAKVDLNRAAMIVEHTTDFGLNIRNQTVYADYQKRYQNTFADQGLGVLTTRLNSVSTSVTPLDQVRLDGYLSSNPRRNVFNQTDFTYKWRMSPEIQHTFLFGAEVGNQKTSDNRNLSCFNFTCATQRVTTPFFWSTIYNPVAFANPNRRRNTDLDLAAAYVQDQIAITKYIDVLAGVRFDHFNLTFRGVGAGARASDFAYQTIHRIDEKWSPRVGLVLKPIEQLSLYGSYSRSFLPAAGDQFNLVTPSVANLAPQGFENYEVGFKAQLLPNLLLTGAVYELNRSNQPLTVNALTAILGNTRTKGGELGLVGNVTDEWQVSLGYGHQDARILRTDRVQESFLNAALFGGDPGIFRTPFLTDVGKVNPSVPRNTFSFWNRYDVSSFFAAGPGVLGVGAGVVYASSFYPAIDNLVIVPGYARIDGALFVKLSENVTGQLNVENVAGAHYFASAHNNNNIMPGAPRSAYLTVNARF